MRVAKQIENVWIRDLIWWSFKWFINVVHEPIDSFHFMKISYECFLKENFNKVLKCIANKHARSSFFEKKSF